MVPGRGDKSAKQRSSEDRRGKFDSVPQGAKGLENKTFEILMQCIDK